MCCDSDCCGTHKCSCGDDCTLCTECGACYRVRQKQERFEREQATRDKPKAEQIGSSDQSFFSRIGKGLRRYRTTSGTLVEEEGNTKNSEGPTETAEEGSASATNTPLVPTAPVENTSSSEEHNGTPENTDYPMVDTNETGLSQSGEKVNIQTDPVYVASNTSAQNTNGSCTPQCHNATSQADGQNTETDPPPSYDQAVSDTQHAPTMLAPDTACPLCKSHRRKSIDASADLKDRPKDFVRSLSCE